MILCVSLLSSDCLCQSDSSIIKARGLIDRFSDKMLRGIERKYQKLETKLRRSSERSLAKMQKQELKLQEKLKGKDSVAAKRLLQSSKEKYAALAEKLRNPGKQVTAGSLNEYLPGLDSLQTSFHFLDQSGMKIPGVPADNLQKIKSVSAQLTSVQAQLQQAGNVKQFLKERRQLLKDQLNRFGMTAELKQVNKEVYYYQQQLSEYKALINDPDKLAKKALSMMRDAPAFKEFMAQNSMLAQLFGSPTASPNGAALQGLQTRASVQQALTQQLGGANANPQQYIQQQVQQAQGEMNRLKDKLNKIGGGSSDMEVPDFKPNHQKTKSLWQRIEYGLNIQSQKANALLPVTSDIAVTAGYKLNDKSTIGVGAGYKIGWGKNISNIRISSEGVSLRSYADVKLKGSIWISGGYEINYQQSFASIEPLKDFSAWQRSGLLGLTKKYKIGKKNGNIQLLWDFLSYSQVPKTTALKLRVGYKL